MDTGVITTETRDRIVRALRTALRTARSADDAAEFQALIDGLDPPADPVANDPQQLAANVQAEVREAQAAAFERANATTEG